MSDTDRANARSIYEKMQRHKGGMFNLVLTPTETALVYGGIKLMLTVPEAAGEMSPTLRDMARGIKDDLCRGYRQMGLTQEEVDYVDCHTPAELVYQERRLHVKGMIVEEAELRAELEKREVPESEVNRIMKYYGHQPQRILPSMRVYDKLKRADHYPGPEGASGEKKLTGLTLASWITSDYGGGLPSMLQSVRPSPLPEAGRSQYQT